VHVGITNAAGSNLDQHLIRTGFGLGEVFDLPLLVFGWDDGSFHGWVPFFEVKDSLFLGMWLGETELGEKGGGIRIFVKRPFFAKR
jgi:hypothetical protein